MLGDLGRNLNEQEGKGKVADGRAKALLGRTCLNLKGLPLTDNDFAWLNKDVKYTNFCYSVCYSPKKHNLSKTGDKFILIADIVTDNSATGRGWRFRDLEDFKSKGNENPFVFFLLYWTNLSQEILDLAKMNQGNLIQLSVDIIGYDKYLREQVKAETGVYPDYSMFMRPSEAIEILKKQKGKTAV